jgi:hypothetical protein
MGPAMFYFDLYHDTALYQQIDSITAIQLDTVVFGGQAPLALADNPPQRQLLTQAFFVSQFPQP